MKKLLSLALIAIMLLGILPMNAVAADPEVIFDDPIFENYIREQIDKPTGKIYASDVDEIGYIHIQKKSITSLKGIEYMTNLRYLYCTNNKLKSIDVNKCVKLRELFCGGNDFSDLDITALANLEQLNCSNNNLSNLDLSTSSKLFYLNCSNNNLTELYVGNITNLAYLEFYGTKIRTIDISKNIGLYTIKIPDRGVFTDFDRILAMKDLSVIYFENGFFYSSNKINDLNVLIKFNSDVVVGSGMSEDWQTGENLFFFSYTYVPTRYMGGHMSIENIRGIKDFVESMEWNPSEETFGQSLGYTLVGGDIYLEIYFDDPDKGDLDGDGKTDVSDVVKIRNWIMGSVTATPEERAKADLDGDGKVDISDIVKLRNIIMGIIE